MSVNAFVDQKEHAKSPVRSIPCISMDALITEHPGSLVFIAIGDPVARKRISKMLEAEFFSFPSILHASAHISPFATLNRGCLAAAGSIIESDSRIGEFSIIDIGTLVDHNVEVPDFSHLRPGTICNPYSTYSS